MKSSHPTWESSSFLPLLHFLLGMEGAARLRVKCVVSRRGSVPWSPCESSVPTEGPFTQHLTNPTSRLPQHSQRRVTDVSAERIGEGTKNKKTEQKKTDNIQNKGEINKQTNKQTQSLLFDSPPCVCFVRYCCCCLLLCAELPISYVHSVWLWRIGETYETVERCLVLSRGEG